MTAVAPVPPIEQFVEILRVRFHEQLAKAVYTKDGMKLAFERAVTETLLTKVDAK